MPTNTLSELQAYLKGMAAQSGQVVFDSAFLSPRVLQLIASGLNLPDQKIVLSDATPADIFLSNDGNTLYVENTTGSFLGLTGATTNVAITQTVSSATGYDFILEVTLPGGWNFGTSFQALSLLEAPGYLETTIGPYFYFSTYVARKPLPVFPNLHLPGSGADTVLGTGLNYYSAVSLTGIYAIIASLVTTTGPFPLYGVIDPNELAPNFDLHAPLGQEGISFGFISATAPWVGVRVVYSQPPADENTGGEQESRLLAADNDAEAASDDDVYPVLVYYLGSTIEIESSNGASLAFEIDLTIPTLSAREVAISIVSNEDTPLNLNSVAALLMDSSSEAITSAVGSVLAPYLGTITLQKFTAVFAPSLSNPLQSVQAQIGTEPPWDTLIPSPSGPGNIKLDLSLNWQIIFGAGSPLWFVTFDAELIFSPTLSFGVEVSAPGLIITGYQKGTVSISLSDLNVIFGGALTIPDDLLTMSFTDFTIVMDVNKKLYSVSGTASAAFSLFGVQILALKDMKIGLTVNAAASPSNYTLNFNGIVALGTIEVSTTATISNERNTDTVFTLHLVNETVGSMLNHLVHLIDPDFDISFGDPWNSILDISLDALVLTVNVTKKTVALTYTLPRAIDLVFIKINGLSLNYKKSTTAASSVMISIDASFFGQNYGAGSGNPPLAWNALNQSPPAIPSGGASLFDLQYAGLGQHIAFDGIQLKTVEEVMTALRRSVIPIQSGQVPPFGRNSLSFSAQSNWLIGAQFSIMGTFSMSVIFNDPDLYGLLISLAGEKAGIFAGLKFEILYRKVTDTIGVYHIELKLPDAMRNLQFGAVSITLPVVILDIYTNGNFRVDLGFPVGLNFANSFSLQIFPFVGFGGFYFALLDGATSNRVPRITNGTFSPVIEFGIALALGVGKTVNAGILSGGITVTVIGILQGVLGWFNPTGPAQKEVYYWIQGTIAIVGKLYATINFGIIQASIDVTAYASVTLTIESHKPIYIAISAGVSVRVSVKIIFFTIHFSFTANVNASFVIGSATPTPWQLASGSGVSSNALLASMRGQQTIYQEIPLNAGYARAVRRSLPMASAPITSWPPVTVLAGGPKAIDIWALPAFTKSDVWTIAASGAVRSGGKVTITTVAPHDFLPGDIVKIAAVADASFNGVFTVATSPGATTFTYPQPGADATSGGGTAGATQQSTAAVMLLAVGNSIDPAAATLQQHRVLYGEDPANQPFNLIAQAMLGWGIYVENHWNIAPPGGGAVRAGDVSTITTTAPHGLVAGNAVTVAGVADGSFNGTFNVVSVPGATSFTYAQSGKPNATSGNGVAGTSFVTIAQLEDLLKQLKNADTVAAAFDYATLTAFLAANFTFNVTPTDAVNQETGITFFPMIPAIQLTDTNGASIQFGSFNEVDLEYQQKVTAYFTLLQVQFEKRNSGDGSGNQLLADPSVSMSTVMFSRYFNMVMSAGVEAAIDLLAQYPYTTTGVMDIAAVGDAIGDATLVDTPIRVIEPNQDAAVLRSGAVFTLQDVVYQIRSTDTFASIATALGAEGAKNLSGGTYTASDLMTVNTDTVGIFGYGPALGVTYSGISYTTLAADTLNLIAGRLLVRAGGPTQVNGLPGLADAVQTLLVLNPSIIDPNAPITGVSTIVLPLGGSYSVVPGDTITLVAAYFLAIQMQSVDVPTFVQSILTANPHLAVTDPAAVQPTGTVIAIPDIVRTMAEGDTIAWIALTMMTTVQVVQANLAAVPSETQILAPQGVMRTPLKYTLAGGDTFNSLVAKFDLTLQDVADAAVAVAGLFADAQALTIDDLGAIEVATLMGDLLAETEFNNIAPQISRFLLSGLRLPDPSDTAFASLTPAELLDPTNLGGIVTKPVYELTGQQYPIAAPAPDGYQITLKNQAGVPWLTLGGGSAITFGLTQDQRDYLATIAATPLNAHIETLTRLSLFQMTPPRTALQNHITWQAALRPGGCLSSGAVTGNPSVWLFPDPLILRLQDADTGTPKLYEVVVAQHGATGPLSAVQANCYTWGTIIDFTVTLPATDGPADSIANAYVVSGVADVDAEILQSVYTWLTTQDDTATLYILYSPNATSANPSGLASDAVAADSTFILKTNLSTVTNSANGNFRAMAEADPTSIYAAAISSPAEFIALLWEASITNSGGFYLNYANSVGGVGLPPGVFGNSSSAVISLMVVLGSQQATKDAPIHSFNNCAVMGDNIDTTSSTLFVQPAIYYTVAGDTLTTVQTSFNAAWGTSFSVLDVATFNQSIQLLLEVGAEMTIPGSGTPYEIEYGDTLSGIVEKFSVPSLQALISAGSNATSQILAVGSPMQFAEHVLSPTATVPPGTVGFEITRTDPDPDGTPYSELTPEQTVDSLFNLVGFSIASEGGFTPSGAGLPTTPADSLQEGSDGLEERTMAAADTNWYYQQSIAVAPFGNPQQGIASAALPAVEWNPYNGIGGTGGTPSVGEVTLDLDLQDIYGNIQPLPPGLDAIKVPVGYYDDIVSLGSWPSLAVAYQVTGTPPRVDLNMTMQQARYVPSASVPVDSAIAAIAADLESYTRIYYQMVQSDVQFWMQTTLAIDPVSVQPRTYALSKTPFLSYACGAYVYLSALSTLKAVQFTVTGSTSVLGVMNQFGVMAAQLFVANQNAIYTQLFTASSLRIPASYTPVPDDTLATIVEKTGQLTVVQLAAANQIVPLNIGADLVVPSRNVTVTTGDSLNSFATTAKASSVGVAVANALRTDILAEGIAFTVGTQTYTLGENDSFAHAAQELGCTVPALAEANQWQKGIFVTEAFLQIMDAVVDEGDTLASLAGIYTGDNVATLATLNADTANVFTPGTPVQSGWNNSPVEPLPDDTLVRYAMKNSVTLEQLGNANATNTAMFADGAAVNIPGVLKQSTTVQYCTYVAGQGDTLGMIAQKFATTPGAIAALNPNMPSGAPIVAGSLWICPPMIGNANGLNGANTLQGLASAYNTDVETIAMVNSAAIGFLAPNIDFTLYGIPITTNAYSTLNALVNMLAEQGIIRSMAEVAQQVKAVVDLIAPAASVLPVPPPSPSQNGAAIEPHFSDSLFQIIVNVSTTRNPNLVDPDFTGTPTISSSVYAVAPMPSPQAAADGLSLAQFATDLQASLPGLYVATGSPVAVDDPATAGTIWGVNFGSAYGAQINYQFNGDATQYFALPPLSTSLMGGPVSITPYIPGQGLVGPAVTQTFQAVDLDTWLNTFLASVDTFLTPAYAVPAYESAGSSVVNVVTQKKGLAYQISQRLQYVLQLQDYAGDLEEAKAALYQAMLTTLSSAFTVDTVVQVPVSVPSGSGSATTAPRLSGKIMIAENANGEVMSDDLPSAYSFSTAKVPLTQPASAATFLFSVRTPADFKEASLDLAYAVTELELPDPGATIGDYQGSMWLKFITKVDQTRSTIGDINIPVPLRSYPSPVMLISQSARQTVEQPAGAIDLLGWNFDFVYQHNDAEQDTPMVMVTFNGQENSPQPAASGGNDIHMIYVALAQFMAVWPLLKDDLALLPQLTPGTTNAAATAAIGAFNTLVTQVAEAWGVVPMLMAYDPSTSYFFYQLQKGRTEEAEPTLTTLTLTSIDPTNGQPTPNPIALWPVVYAKIDDVRTMLEPVGTPTQTQAVYQYPSGIPAGMPVEQSFVYTWPSGSVLAPPEPPEGVSFPGMQIYGFNYVNVLGQQNGRAGVSITRNLALVSGFATDPAFVYRTPVTNFTNVAVPSIQAANDIAIGSGNVTGIAAALGLFLETLFTAQNQWQATDRIDIRFSAAYSYAVATTPGVGDGEGQDLRVVVPILLVPSFSFDPQNSWKTGAEGSFVDQVQAAITEWQKNNTPSAEHGAYQFDLTVFAGQGVLQSLIHASSLLFEITG